MDPTARIAGGAHRSGPPASEMVQDRLRHDRANIVHSLKEQHELWILAAQARSPIGYTETLRTTPLPHTATVASIADKEITLLCGPMIHY